MDPKNVLTSQAVFVITVCRNEDKYIAPFIESILTSTVPVQLILVDNASDDRSKKELESFSDRVTILWQEKNLGFGIANNVGIKYAMECGAEYIFLLNMDMLIEPETIETLLQISKRNPSFSIISPLCFNFEKDSFEKMFTESLTKKNMQYNADVRLFFSEAFLHKEFSKELYETTFINAAHWFMPISTIKQLGGFNPVFFPIYHEDDEFLQRAVMRNLKIGFTPSARVFHDTETRTSSVLTHHGTCSGYYLKLLKSERWSKYYFFLAILFLRMLKNVILFRKENLKYNFLCAAAFIRWKKILKQTWNAGQNKESIGLFCDITPECIPPYIKQ